MNKAALFLALSLSIFSFGCGMEKDGTSSGDNSGMGDQMDNPFSGMTDPPEGKLLTMTTVCKTNVYFYESTDGTRIDWIGYWNKSELYVKVYIYDERSDGSVTIARGYTTPGGKAGGSGEQGRIDKNTPIRIESEKFDGQQNSICETVHLTMPQ